MPVTRRFNAVTGQWETVQLPYFGAPPPMLARRPAQPAPRPAPRAPAATPQRFNALTGAFSPWAFGPPPPGLGGPRAPSNPAVAFGAPPATMRRRPQGAVPRRAPEQQAQPTQGGVSPAEFLAMMGQGVAAPFKAAGNFVFSPQGQNESRLAYGMRQGLADPVESGYNFMSAVGNDLSQFAGWLAETPASQAESVFRAMVQQESGGQQFNRNGQPLTSSAGAIGIAQVMPGTAPEAAKLAGLKWDPERYRTDPEYNYKLGYAYFQQKLKENNGDVMKAVAAYNAGQGRVQQAERRAAATGQPWTAFLPSETQQYLPKVLQNMGALAEGFGAAAPAFNPAPYQNLMGAYDQAAAMLTAPISATFTELPLPDRPTPQEFVTPDTSAGDAAFAATRPVNPFDDPKEAARLERQQAFKGIGAAIASLTGEEGIGTMLMKMGAGALVGRARGQEMVDAKEEEFQRMLVEYNRALASREDGKAANAANVLNQNIQQRNQYANELWADNARKIIAKQPQVVNGRLITYERDPEDPNKWTMNSVQIDKAIQAEALINKANVGVQMGQAEAQQGNFAYQHQQATARTALGVATQQALSTGNGQAAGEGLMIEGAQRIRASVQAGTWRNLFNDPQTAAQIEQLAVQEARREVFGQFGITEQEGRMMGPDGRPLVALPDQIMRAMQEKIQDSLTAKLTEFAAKRGTLPNMLINPVATSAYYSQGESRTSTRTGSKGSTTTSSWVFENE